MSSPGADDVCPICLCPIDEEFSRPENCQHRFDLECLTEWAKLRLSCPSCRAGFGAVYTYRILEGKPTLHKVQKMEQPAELEPFDEANPLDFTVCEICSGGMHEELLLICDQCDRGFHTYCLSPPLDAVPVSEQWFCPQCEQSRMSQPSTSRRMEPSARAIRLVQRTALAERVRRMLARNRHVVEVSESSTDDEEEQIDDEEEEEEEEEEEKEKEEEEDSAASSEEEIRDFYDDDARVLGESVYDIPCGNVTLPAVRRRSKKERNAGKKTTKSRKKKVSKRRTKGKRKKVQRVRSKKTHTKAKDGPMDAFVSRRGVARDPVARLSLLGAGLEPVVDEDPLVTENSRRFDRPIIRRRGEHLPTPEEEVEENRPAADACDLLGSIIPEQTKTLAPGRLFAVRGGRFNTTEDFEKYKARTTNQMSSELKERLGIPVEKGAAVEGPSRHNGTRETRKVYNDVAKLGNLPKQDGDSAPSLFKKPELKDATRFREDRKDVITHGRNESTRGVELGVKKVQESSLCSQQPDQCIKGGPVERVSATHRSCQNSRDRTDRDREPEERYQSSTQKAKHLDKQVSAEKRLETEREYHDRGSHDPSRAGTYGNTERSWHAMSSEPHMRVSSERASTTQHAHHDHDSHRISRDGSAERSSKTKQKLSSREQVPSTSTSYLHHQRHKYPPVHRRERLTSPDLNLTQSDKQSVDERTLALPHKKRCNQNDDGHRHHDRNEKWRSASETARKEHDRGRYMTDRHISHSLQGSDPLKFTNSERKLRFEESEREDRGDADPVQEKIPSEDPLGGTSNEWMPNLKASTTVLPTLDSGFNHGEVKSVAKDKKMTNDELLTTIEGFAKEGIRPYKKRLTREEYKDVMRAVVRECYKKRVLDEIRIKEKVRHCVHAVKNGELLVTGHYSSKRSEGTSRDQSPVPPKRPRVDT